MAGAELFGLDDQPPGQAGKGGLDLTGPVADDGEHPVAAQGFQGLLHVPQHGQPKQGPEHLGGIAFHARALPRRQNQRADTLLHHPLQTVAP